MPIDDYKTIRGFNYIASWSGNAISHWRFYDSAQAELELGYLASIGCNSIRVWLSFAVWDVERDGYLAKLTHLLEAAAARGMSVMAILWDAVGMTPSATPYDDLVGWTANPGQVKVADRAFLALGDEYVAAVVVAAVETGTDVIWDVMNEADNQPEAWVDHYLEFVKTLDPSSPVTVGYFFADSTSKTAAEVDVLSFHPYGMFRANVVEPAKEAATAAGVENAKPILASELGFPGGGGQRYEDVLRFAADQGVGFYLFQAMIGDHPAFPWKGGTGFFFKDGTIRDLEAVRAFQSLAQEQGFELEAFPLVADEASPLWVPYSPMPPSFGTPEATVLLTAFGEHYGADYPLVEDGLLFYTTLLQWTFASFWLAGKITTAELETPEQLLQELATAAAAGDWRAAGQALSAAAALAGDLIELHGLGEPANRPPEILKVSVAPNPFPGDTSMRLEIIAWDPEGAQDVAVAAALAFSPNDHYLFTVHLQHAGSGFYSFDSPVLAPFAPGQAFELLFVVADKTGAIDYVWPISVTGIEAAPKLAT